MSPIQSRIYEKLIKFSKTHIKSMLYISNGQGTQEIEESQATDASFLL